MSVFVLLEPRKKAYNKRGIDSDRKLIYEVDLFEDLMDLVLVFLEETRRLFSPKSLHKDFLSTALQWEIICS